MRRDTIRSAMSAIQTVTAARRPGSGAHARIRPSLGARLTAIVTIVFAASLAACSAPREAAVPAGSVVMIIGDSITAGYGVDTAEAWPAQLAQRTGWQVVAAGVSGDRTSGGRARLPALLDEAAPALVIIELGGNDLLQHVPESEIVANLEAMINAVRARGAKVVLMAAPQPTALGALAGLSVAGFYREIAKRDSVPLIENALPKILSNATQKLDPLHPTPQGHRELADRAFDELAAMGFAARR
jgi:acyl-CoA thioesterase I